MEKVSKTLRYFWSDLSDPVKGFRPANTAWSVRPESNASLKRGKDRKSDALRRKEFFP